MGLLNGELPIVTAASLLIVDVRMLSKKLGDSIGEAEIELNIDREGSIGEAEMVPNTDRELQRVAEIEGRLLTMALKEIMCLEGFKLKVTVALADVLLVVVPELLAETEPHTAADIERRDPEPEEKLEVEGQKEKEARTVNVAGPPRLPEDHCDDVGE